MKTPLRSVLFTALLAASAHGQETRLAVTPVECVFTLAVEELPKRHQPWSWDTENTTGCKITYAITGKNIASVDSASLDITAITDGEGNDLLAYARKDKNSLKLGGVGTGGDGDERYATINIFIPTEKPMTLPNVTGTVNVRIAEKTETQTLTFNTAEKGVEQTAGPFTVSIPNEKNRISFGEGFQMKMKGDERLLKEVKLTSGGKEINNNGRSSGSKEATLYFAETPATPEFTLSVTYYTDLQEVPVRIGGNF